MIYRMRIETWDGSLALRLPDELVRRLDLQEGDELDFSPNRRDPDPVRRTPHAEAAALDILASLQRFRGRLPASQRLSRDAAHRR